MKKKNNWQKKAEKAADILLFIFTTYIYGLLLGFIFHFFRASGKIKLENYKNFPRWQGNLIVLSNHPSLLEPFLLPALFFSEYVFRPFKYAPYSTPDKKNFFHWFFIKPRAIPIERGNKRQNGKALIAMKKILKKGRSLILFPEGGRTEGAVTAQGNNFFCSKKGALLHNPNFLLS